MNVVIRAAGGSNSSGIVLPTVSSFPSPFVVFAVRALTKKGQDINYTAHKREAGHTESVSGFNSVGRSRFEEIL